MPYKRTTKRRVVRRKRRTGQQGKGIFGDIFRGIKKGVKFLRKHKVLSKGAKYYGMSGMPGSRIVSGYSAKLRKKGFGLRSSGGRRVKYKGKKPGPKRGRKRGAGLRRSGGAGLVRSGGTRTRKTRVMGKILSNKRRVTGSLRSQFGRGRVGQRKVFP